VYYIFSLWKAFNTHRYLFPRDKTNMSDSVRTSFRNQTDLRVEAERYMLSGKALHNLKTMIRRYLFGLSTTFSL